MTMTAFEAIQRASFWARMLRWRADPESVLDEAYALVGIPCDRAAPLEDQIVRLARLAGARDREIGRVFRGAHRGPVLNRPGAAGPTAVSDPEALRLRAFVVAHAREARALFLENGFPSFSLARREVSLFNESIPSRVRGLIDYAVAVPVVFQLDASSGDYWAICSAYAKEYERIYADPSVYGVRSHDLTDLVIEHLLWFESESLLYAQIGS